MSPALLFLTSTSEAGLAFSFRFVLVSLPGAAALLGTGAWSTAYRPVWAGGKKEGAHLNFLLFIFFVRIA